MEGYRLALKAGAGVQWLARAVGATVEVEPPSFGLRGPAVADLGNDSASRRRAAGGGVVG